MSKMNYYKDKSDHIWAYSEDQMEWVKEHNKIKEQGLTPISEAEANAILNPPPTKEQRIEAALSALEAEKNAKLQSLKIEYNGANYDADERSQLRVTGAVTLLSLAPSGTTQQWVDADNITRELSAGDLAAIGAIIANTITQITLDYRAKKDAAIAAKESEKS